MKPINDEQWNIIDALLRESCQQLFDNYEVPIGPVGTPGSQASPTGAERPAELAAFIGYTCDHMKGTLLVITSRALVHSSDPTTRHSETFEEEDLRDWLGELANQLLGRLKNKLIEYGMPIELTTPTTLAGMQLTPGKNSSLAGRRTVFCSGEEAFQLYFNAKMTEDAQLVYTPTPPSEQTDDGDPMFF